MWAARTRSEAEWDVLQKYRLILPIQLRRIEESASAAVRVGAHGVDLFEGRFTHAPTGKPSFETADDNP